MIFLDANVFMYAAGAAHPHKEPSVALVQRAARGELEVATSVEVLQEILHRYRSIRRWQAGKQVYDEVRLLVPTVLPVTTAEIDRARELLDAIDGLSARDALHAASCETAGIDVICTYDRGFDAVEFLDRRAPDAL